MTKIWDNHALVPVKPSYTWWRHQMELFSALLVLWAGSSRVIGGFPPQRPVPRNFDVVFDQRLNKRLSKQSTRRWFETPLCSLWRHRYENAGICHFVPISQIPQCIKYPTMHHFVTEMCTHAHFCYKMLHCGIWDWCIVGFVQQVIINQTKPKPSTLILYDDTLYGFHDIHLTHWALNDMAAILQMTILHDLFSVVCWLTFHWNLFVRVQMTKQFMFRQWLGADQATT